MLTDTLSFSDFFAAWDLFQDPILAGTIAGTLLGFLGVYIILRRMVFLSAALSQSAGLGVTLSFYAQIKWAISPILASPFIGATAMTIVTALLLLSDKTQTNSRRDNFLGLAYLVGASGALMVGTKIVQESHDIQSVLFGSAVMISHSEFLVIAIMATFLFIIHLWWIRGFIITSFDRTCAVIRGLPVKTIEMILLLSITITISVCTRILGAMPVFAFSVLPAMAAVRLGVNIPTTLIISSLIGALSGFIGYILAFIEHYPVGASQTIVAASFVLLCEILRYFKRYIPKQSRVS